MYLTDVCMDKAKDFINTAGRPLERSLYRYEFESGSAEDVLRELVQFQNEDGGFGNALEPDLRCRPSSALATTVGLQILSRLRIGAEHEMVRRSIQYLADTFNKERMGWDIIPKAAENAPRAPWWNYGAFSQEWGNPNAEILGFFCEYSDLVPHDVLNDLTEYAIRYLNERCELKEMHEMFCFVRLAERMPADRVRRMTDKLDRFIDNCVVKNLEDRQGYCAYPLQIVGSPESRYYSRYSEVIPQDLDGIISSQEEDGGWAVNWSWGQYEEDWAKAKEEWRCVITYNSLLTLKSFDRLRK